MTDGTLHMENHEEDRTLRPLALADFAGNEAVVHNLNVFVQAAIRRGDPLDHILFSGPPGTGKTTLAGVLAKEMGTKLVVVNCASLKTKGELAGVICGLEHGDILFLDEIHRLKLDSEEMLYPVMEDSKIEIISAAGVVSLDLPRFTIVGATTRSGALSRPFFDRFGEVCNLELYNTDTLARIVDRSAKLMKFQCTQDACVQIAKRSRGTPRIAMRILRRVRDFAQFEGFDTVDGAFVVKVTQNLGIDSIGLDKQSRNFLSVLSSKNRPVGVSAMASYLNESKDTIEDSIEPHLLLSGLIERTSSGRIITDNGKKHLLMV